MPCFFRRLLRPRSVLLVSLSLGAVPGASAGLIDFEGFATGDLVNGTPISADGVTVTVDAFVPVTAGAFDSSSGFLGLAETHPYNSDPLANGREAAVVFDTQAFSGGDSDLQAPFSNLSGLGNLSPGNVLILHEQPLACSFGAQPSGAIGNCPDPDDIGARPAGRFLVTFSTAVLLDSIDFFDVEGVENGTANPGDPGFADQVEKNGILLSNGGGAVGGNFFVPDTGGDNKWAPVDFGGVLVDQVEIRLHGSGAIDNIAFTTTTVPAPGGLALLLGGLALLGWRRAR